MDTDDALAGHSENYFVPMADLLAGIVFVLLILIMSLALVTRTDFVTSEQAIAEMKRVATELEKARALQRAYLEPREVASAALQATLSRISVALSAVGLPNVLDSQAGSITMHSRLFFDEGAHALSEAGRTRADQLALIMTQYLGCLSNIPRPRPEACAGIPSARLDRLVVAAHVGRFEKGADGIERASTLTGLQALAVYSRLAETSPVLLELKNVHGQPGLEFRGFGDRRPPPKGGTVSALPSADRIELILRMEVPAVPDDVWTLPVRLPPQ
jgi:hypothetical protein